MKILSMLGGAISDAIQSWFSKIVDFITGFFAFIPQTFYFIYTCAASFLDLLQYLIRKLAGLDVYYVNGEAQSGDIVVSFVRGILGIDKSETYSSLSTVFWSLVIFGVILLVLMTIFAIIKAHYNSDYKKSNPFPIIASSLKSLALMAIVPIITVLGLYFCNIMLQALDQATSYESTALSVFETTTDESGNTTSVVASKLEAGEYNGAKTYSSYDFFGSFAWTNSTTFSGALFKVAVNNCNRVRTGTYTAATSASWGEWQNFEIFYSTKSGDAAIENVAEQIDYAFACDLRLVDKTKNAFIENEAGILVSSFANGYSAICATGLIKVKNFSKYNVGLVWYYYNLWGFNFFIGVAGIIVFLTVLSNIVFGLITRMIEMLALFFVFPPLIGLTPLDGGSAFGKWKGKYLSDVLMAFGTIVGMNLFFLILPFLNNITFFPSALLNGIMDCVIMLAGLTMVKGLIATLSGFIGAADANAVGESTKKAVGEIGAKAAGATLKGAAVGAKILAPGVKAGVGIAKGAGRLAGTMGSKIANSKAAQNLKNKTKELGENLKGKLADKKEERANNKAIRKDAWQTLRTHFMSPEDAAKYNEKQLDKEREKSFKASSKEANKKLKEDAKRIKGILKGDLSDEDKATEIAKIDSGYNTAKALKNQKTRDGLKRGALAAATGWFGGQVVKDENGKVNVGASMVSGFKAFGQAAFDISKVAVGEVLGGNALSKKFKSKDTGMKDSIRSMLDTAGVLDSLDKSKTFGKYMGTDATKEKKDKNESTSAATAQLEAMQSTAQNSKNTSDAVNSLIDILKK